MNLRKLVLEFVEANGTVTVLQVVSGVHVDAARAARDSARRRRGKFSDSPVNVEAGRRSAVVEALRKLTKLGRIRRVARGTYAPLEKPNATT